MARLAPVVEDAIQRLAPAIDVARDRVQHDLLPRFSAALHEAAEHPMAQETSRRLTAATAALRGELEVPAKPKRGIARKLAQVAVAGAVLAGVVIAVRKLLGPTETGWEAHEPSQPYVADPVADVVDDVSGTVAAGAAAASDVAEDVTDSVAAAGEDAAAVQDASDELEDDAEAATDELADLTEEAPEAAAEAADSEVDKAEDAAAAVQGAEGDASPLAASPYGEGSYVGQNPPEGYDIKGNERSRKYHLQGSGGYERTITDVWFNSTDAAERAGFVRAQR
ncbi:MAG: hypothetical protein HZY73_14125 [Micropruina sp.]|nr:MAG: hypothetical protein HZY73_14125 [Micropruina sp.]